MKLFYRIRPEDKKDCVRIQSLVRYDTLSIIHQDSILSSSNMFTIARGSKKFDIIQFEDSLNFAISERVKKLLTENSVTGWNSFPVIIKGIKESYHAFQNLSKAGPILNLEAINNYESENREFDISTWDGSDVFNLEGTLLNVITPRVKEILENAHVTNLEIFRL